MNPVLTSDKHVEICCKGIWARYVYYILDIFVQIWNNHKNNMILMINSTCFIIDRWCCSRWYHQWSDGIGGVVMTADILLPYFINASIFWGFYYWNICTMALMMYFHVKRHILFKYKSLNSTFSPVSGNKICPIHQFCEQIVG